MRVMLIGVVGGTGALAALAVSWIGAGLVQAGSLLVAIFIAPVTVGLMISAVVDGVERRRSETGGGAADVVPRFRGFRARYRSWARSAARCGTCGERMAQLQFIWVCAECDGIAVEA